MPRSDDKLAEALRHAINHAFQGAPARRAEAALAYLAGYIETSYPDLSRRLCDMLKADHAQG